MELKTEVGGKTKHMVPCSKEQIKPWIHLTYQKFPKYIYTDQENWRFLILQLNDTNKLKIIKVNNKSCSSKGGDEDLYDQIWKRERTSWAPLWSFVVALTGSRPSTTIVCPGLVWMWIEHHHRLPWPWADLDWLPTSFTLGSLIVVHGPPIKVVHPTMLSSENMYFH